LSSHTNKEKREKHDAALLELKTLKDTNADNIATTKIAIADLNSAYDTQISTTQPIIDGFDGLMARVTALGTLPLLRSFFIFLLFLTIETSPVIAKLRAPKGEYHFTLEDQETAIKYLVDLKLQEHKLAMITYFLINDSVYKAITKEDKLYKYKHKKAKGLMQQQADAFYKA